MLDAFVQPLSLHDSINQRKKDHNAIMLISIQTDNQTLTNLYLPGASAALGGSGQFLMTSPAFVA